MNKSKIKICGIKELETLNCCIENKINYFGLVFYKKSQRNISYENAIKLIEYSRNKNISSVGVFVNEGLENLCEIIKKLKINFLQLHGDENNDYIKFIKKNNNINIIKSISINCFNDFKNISKYKDNDFYLFDYKPVKGELPGGNAKTFDWELIKGVKIDKPWFISGGININNIKKIENFAIPYGIDISSGVEVKPGIKSNKKIKSLIEFYGPN